MQLIVSGKTSLYLNSKSTVISFNSGGSYLKVKLEFIFWFVITYVRVWIGVTAFIRENLSLTRIYVHVNIA